MLKRLYSNYSATIIIIFTIIFIGIVQFSKLPIALYPQCEKPRLYAEIGTGTTEAKEFMEHYGKEIEISLSSVDKVLKVQGDYYNGYASYTVEFDWGVKSEEARTKTRTALSPIESNFPDSWGTFSLYFDSSESAKVIVSIFSDKYSPEELADIAETSLVPYLDRIDGMNDIFVTRFDARYISITIDPYRLISFGLDFDSVLSKLKSGEQNRGLGKLDLKSGGTYQVTAMVEEDSIGQLENLIVGQLEKKTIRLKDIATIILEENLPNSVYKANGRRSLLIVGESKPDANIKKVCDEFISVIKEQTAGIDETIQMHILLNPSDFINEAVRNVIIAVILGMSIAIVIIFLFLGSIKNTIIISVSIPLSLIGGFILMNFIDMEINLISLGAMALAVGMVVDGSIVVLENIIRNLNEKQPQNTNERLDVIIKSTMEVKTPVIASLLTTIIVFAPLPFTSPITAAILGDLAIVMVCVLSISIFVTLIFIPPLAMMLKVGISDGNRRTGVYFFSFQFITFFNWTKKLYLWSLNGLLNRRIVAISSLLVFFSLFALGGYILLTEVKREIISTPYTDKLFLMIQIKNEIEEISDVEEMVMPYEKILLTEFSGEISHILSIVNLRNIQILSILKDKSHINHVKKAFEDRFQNTPQLDFYVRDWTPTTLEIPLPPLIHLDVNEKDEDTKREMLNQIEEILRDSEEISYVNSTPETYKEDYLRIIFNKEQMIPLMSIGDSSTVSAIESFISGHLERIKVKEINMGKEKVNIHVQIGNGYIKSIGDIENLLLRFGEKIIPLKSLARVTHATDWGNYHTENGVEVASLRAWSKSSIIENKDQLFKKIKAAIKRHPDVNPSKISFRNAEKEIDENIHSLVIAMVFAILFIFIIITLQFGSVIQAGIIMLSIPFGFLGVSFSLWFFSSTLSINSMLGLILLCGTAVNNSIIFLDFYRKINKRGKMKTKNALIETAKLRFRPIMITTVTTILGMFPISLGMGSGGEILRPLGIAICGGLWISTILTILFIPLAIIISEKISRGILKLHLKKGVAASVILITLSFGIFGKIHAEVPRNISLKMAEEMSLKYHLELKAAVYEKNSAQASYKGVYSEILPTISIEKRFSEQHVEYEDDPLLSGKYTLKEDKEIISIEEKIQNPLLFWNDRNLLKNNVEKMESNVSDLKKILLSEVRKLYFRRKVIEISLKNALRNKTLAEEMLSSSQNRYKKGFIHKSDANRAVVKFNEMLLSVKERTADFENTCDNLAFLIGADSDESFQLSDGLPLKFKYFQLSDEAILSRARKGHPEKIERMKLDLKEKELLLKRSNYGFLPDITIGASFSREYADDQTYKLRDPEVYAFAKWTLFTGGKQFFDRKSHVFEKKAITERLRHTKDDISRFIKEIINDLNLLEEQFHMQKSSVEFLEDITKESEKRFNKGLVSLKEVNDDFSSFLDAQDKLHEICLAIVEKIALLSMVSGDDALFYWMF